MSEGSRKASSNTKSVVVVVALVVVVAFVVVVVVVVCVCVRACTLSAGVVEPNKKKHEFGTVSR